MIMGAPFHKAKHSAVGTGVDKGCGKSINSFYYCIFKLHARQGPSTFIPPNILFYI
jgi:hypothetical protein